jgi:hypothetical protein
MPAAAIRGPAARTPAPPRFDHHSSIEGQTMSQLVHQLPLSAVAEAPAIQPLAEQEISGEVLVEKYAKGNETSVHDVRRRVARALAANETRSSARTGKRASSGRRKTASCPPGASTRRPARRSRRR